MVETCGYLHWRCPGSAWISKWSYCQDKPENTQCRWISVSLIHHQVDDPPPGRVDDPPLTDPPPGLYLLLCRGLVGRERRAHTFFVLLWNEFEAVLKWLVFWVRSHTLFDSATSLLQWKTSLQYSYEPSTSSKQVLTIRDVCHVSQRHGLQSWDSAVSYICSVFIKR